MKLADEVLSSFEIKEKRQKFELSDNDKNLIKQFQGILSSQVKVISKLKNEFIQVNIKKFTANLENDDLKDSIADENIQLSAFQLETAIKKLISLLEFQK